MSNLDLPLNFLWPKKSRCPDLKNNKKLNNVISNNDEIMNHSNTYGKRNLGNKLDFLTLMNNIVLKLTAFFYELSFEDLIINYKSLVYIGALKRVELIFLRDYLRYIFRSQVSHLEFHFVQFEPSNLLHCFYAQYIICWLQHFI